MTTYRHQHEAFSWYKKAADQGHLESSYKVAVMYKIGTDTEQSYEKAMEYFKKVADSDDDPSEHPIRESMREIGWLYYYGNGVEKDEYEALHWFKESVEQIRCLPMKQEWTTIMRMRFCTMTSLLFARC